MKDLLWMARRTLSVTFRKKSNWLMLVILPIAGILISMLIYSGSNSSPLRIGVVNQDGTETITADTAAYLQKLDGAQAEIMDETEMKKKLISGELDTGVVLEQGFAQHVRSGKPQGLSIVSVKGEAVTSYVQSLLRSYVSNIASIGVASHGDPAVFDSIYRAYQHPSFQLQASVVEDTSRTKNMTYQSLGFLVAFMMFSAVNLTELLLKEKENRTFLRLLTSPVSAKMYVLSNVAVNLVLILLQILLTLFVMKNILGINSGVPAAELVLVLLLFGLAAIGLSLLIVAFAKNSGMAGALQNLIITPTCLLAGCYFPVGIMPESVQKIAAFLPQHWVLETVDRLQSGTKFSSLYLNLLILLAFAAVFSLIAVYRFSRNNDTRTFV
jgi:ABC-2 type transport system permease protein